MTAEWGSVDKLMARWNWWHVTKIPSYNVWESRFGIRILQWSILRRPFMANCLWSLWLHMILKWFKIARCSCQNFTTNPRWICLPVYVALKLPYINEWMKARSQQWVQATNLLIRLYGWHESLGYPLWCPIATVYIDQTSSLWGQLQCRGTSDQYKWSSKATSKWY